MPAPQPSLNPFRTTPSTTADPLEARMAEIRAAGSDPVALRLVAEKLATEASTQETENQKLRQVIVELHDEFQKLTAPENHPVTITRVEANGTGKVEVAGKGVGRLEVAVHPRVPREKLRVGARGVLTKQRNCLIGANGVPAEWTAIGRFERRLDDQRVLLEQHGEWIGVRLADDLLDCDFKKGDLIGFDRDDANLALARLPKPEQQHLFEELIPTDDFSQLGGLDRVCERIKRAISFRLQHADVARKYRLKSKRGLLLSGPPGNGKTRVARCAANFITQLLPGQPCRFMVVQGSQDYEMWLGKSEQNLRDRFDAAREAARFDPVVFFLDELDAIAQRRGREFGSSAPDRILNTLLALLDGVQQINNLIVIGATNRIDTLDPGVVRPGRFDEKIEIGPPNRAAARAILERYLVSELPLSPDCDRATLIDALLSRVYSPKGSLAELGKVKLADNRQLPIRARDLISGAILESLVTRAAEDAADREIRSGQIGLSEDDLVQSLEAEMNSLVRLLTPDNVKSYLATIPHDARPIAIEK